MDEFGVLVQGIGFKSQRNSTPLAELKPKPKSQSSNPITQSFDSSNSLPVDELDGIFRSNPSKPPQPQNFFGGDDIFGGHASSSHQYGAVDLESVFSSSKSNNINRTNSPGFNDVDDLFGSFVGYSNEKQQERSPNLDELIPGFGEAVPSKTKVNSETHVRLQPPNSSSTAVDDPFLVFESSGSQPPDTTWPHATPFDHSTTQKPKPQSSFDEFDDFIMGTNTSGSTASDTDYVDEIFGGGSGTQRNNAARPSPMSENSLFGDFFSADKKPEVNPNSTSSFTVRTTTFKATNAGGEFTSLFGEVTTSSEVFQEVEGESEERRRARLNRHIRTNARMAEALAEKNQRDLESQHEQEERLRLAQKLDNNIRRWSMGKEGNLRALLSSLQEVLWPECGWRPISLTDMITSESVKKVYKKATLCIHPDKVQQKGASIEQKYIAEKVFDLLKEAWKKFCTEELQ